MTDSEPPVFTRTDGLGPFTVRPVDSDGDAEMLHGWVTHPESAFYLLQNADLDDVRREFTRIAASGHHDAFIGLLDAEPRFLMERFDPAHVALQGMYDAEPGDVGMQFLSPPRRTRYTASPSP